MSSVFFGRNLMQETREAITMGKIELNMKPMRIKVQIVRDELHQLDRLIYSFVKDMKNRNEMRDQLKRTERLLNDL